MEKLTDVNAYVARTSGNRNDRQSIVWHDRITGPIELDGAPPLTADEMVRFEAEWERLETVDVPIPRIDPFLSYPSSSRGWLLRAIETRTCQARVGLVLEAGTNRDLVVAPCRVCPACRKWDRALDEYRMIEAAGDSLALAIVTEDRWDATRKRLARAEAPYLSIPISSDRRAVIVPSGAPVPAVAVGDLAEVLANLDQQRDRGDRRRMSSSGMRSRVTVERIAFPVQPGEQPRQVVGFFNPSAVSDSDELLEVAASIHAAVNSLGIQSTRAGLTVTVDGRRHMPRLEKLWQWLGVHWLDAAIPWWEGGPPPALDSVGWAAWSTARFGHPAVWEDPPLDSYREASA